MKIVNMKNLFSVALALTGASYAAFAAEHLEDKTAKAAENISGKPEVFLLGDSIRMGYCQDVKTAMKDVADVRWPSENCANSQNMLTHLSWWKGIVAKPAVIQFNCGHWDVSLWDGDEEPITSLEEYGRNIKLIIRRLRRDYPGATVVFATTTPMNPNGTCSKNKRTTDVIRRYNAKAVEVARAEGVPVNDLFAFAERWPSSDYADYAHFSKAANRKLGKRVADFLGGWLLPKGAR